MENKKVFAFDLGRVLFDFDYNIALEKIKDKIGVPMEEVIKELFDNDFGLSFEKGELSSREFYSLFKNTFKADLSYECFVDVWCDIFSPKEDVISFVKSLKGKYPLYLISNINELHFEYLFKKYEQVFSPFDHLILSYEVKSIKPEEKIYQILKDKAGVSFEDIIYIDDRKELIVEGKNFNLECIQFTNFNQLIVDLKNLGISAN
ncbi:MAG: HAD family phosphatase [Candidatus Omnitrophica bacterium]|nr:HAD family phosphatase [Candidatus Omnitrophota bacterium]